jgi:hypothetical protein
MSEVNLNFDLSNVTSEFSVSQISANLNITPIDLSFSTAPLAITVTGTGAYYNSAIHNSPIAYTNGNVYVQIPENPIVVSGGTFASVEYEITGTTEAGTGGTSAESTLTVTGTIPARGTIAEKAFANFTVSGVTPNQYNNDATSANATFTFSGTTSTIVGGTSTKFTIDISTYANSGTGSSMAVVMPAYGPYPQTTRTITLATNSNANVIVQSIQDDLSSARPTLNFTQSNYTDPSANISQNIGFPATTANIAGWATNGSDYYITIQTTGGNVANIFRSNGSTANVSSNAYVGVANAIVTGGRGTFADNTWLFPIIVQSGTSYSLRVLRSTVAAPASSDFTNTPIVTTDLVASMSKIYHFGTAFYLGTVTRTGATYNYNLHSSTDGTTWSPVVTVSNPTNTLKSVMASNGTTIVLLTADRNVRTSTDGTTWAVASRKHATSSTQEYRANDICFTGTHLVSVSDGGIILRNTVADLSTSYWTSIVSGTGQNLNSIASDGAGRVVAVGNAGRILQSSDNGATFTTVTTTWTADILSIEYIGANRYLLTTSTSTYIYENKSYRRLSIDTNFIFTGSSISAGATTGTNGANLSPVFSTTAGTTSSQAQDSISFSDGTNGQVFQLGYGLTAEQVTKDVFNRMAITGWTDTNPSSTTIYTQRSTGGLINTATQMSASYTTGTGSAQGTGAVARTTSNLGTNNTTNPQPQLALTLDTGTLTVDLPYGTNMSGITNWTSLLSSTGWVFTQSQAGAFRVEHVVTGIVSDINASISNGGTATILRSAYSDGTGSTLDPNTPYVQIEFASDSGYNPQVYRLYFDWSAGYDASSIAQFIRTNASVIGATFTGSGTNVVITANSKGPQTQPIITIGGTGSTQWNINNSYVNGTGASSVFVTINENTFSIGENLTPQQSVVDLINQFYSDDWIITRSGANQFRLISTSFGPKTEPTVTTTSTTQTLTKTTGSVHSGWVNGTAITASVPAHSINLGLIGVTLPGITLVQN